MRTPLDPFGPGKKPAPGFGLYFRITALITLMRSYQVLSYPAGEIFIKFTPGPDAQVGRYKWLHGAGSS